MYHVLWSLAYLVFLLGHSSSANAFSSLSGHNRELHGWRITHTQRLVSRDIEGMYVLRTQRKDYWYRVGCVGLYAKRKKKDNSRRSIIDDDDGDDDEKEEKEKKKEEEEEEEEEEGKKAHQGENHEVEVHESLDEAMDEVESDEKNFGKAMPMAKRQTTVEHLIREVARACNVEIYKEIKWIPGRIEIVVSACKDGAKSGLSATDLETIHRSIFLSPSPSHFWPMLCTSSFVSTAMYLHIYSSIAMTHFTNIHFSHWTQVSYGSAILNMILFAMFMLFSK